MTGQKIITRVQKSLQGIEQVREAGRRRIKPFFLEKDRKNTRDSLSRQSSETIKTNTKLVLVSQEPLA